MALPDFSMRQLLEAGVHYGHQTQRWNPRMAEFIYGDRNGIHIIDLTQTVPLLDQALKVVRDTVARGGRILFVGTKRQAQKPVAEAAAKCAQYYMNHRWLGGTLTNWKTVSLSLQRLKQLANTLGVASNPVDVPGCLVELTRAASAAGGRAPLPLPPDPASIAVLQGKTGGEQQAAVADAVDDLLGSYRTWR
ncbi:MAG: 30S ribosomal protein S2, partial [Gemmobacter sp.]